MHVAIIMEALDTAERGRMHVRVSKGVTQQQ